MTTFNQTLNETLMVTDRLAITRPYAYVTNSVRMMASTLLRLRRKPVRYVSFDLPVHYAYLKPGSVIWANHDQMPGAATGADRYDTWRLIPLHVVEVHDSLGSGSNNPKIGVKCIDLRENYCSWWSPLRTDIGMTDDLNGIAIIDRAGGWETERNQVGYGLRPPGNDAYQEVLPSNPILDAFGLLLEGGEDINHLLNSSFSEGPRPSDTFTSWSKTLTGAAVGVGWELYTLIDANGFRRAIQLATYATGEQAYVSQTVNGLHNRRMGVRVFYKDGGAVDRMNLRVQRSDTSQYLDAATGTWGAGPINNELTPGSGVIDTNRFVTEAFDTTSGGTVNLSVSVGHFSAAFNAAQISQIQGVELIEAGSTTGFIENAWRFRSPLPTKAVAVTRARNLTKIVNDSAVAIVSPTRGFVKMKARPHWSNDDLHGSSIKYVWAAELGGIGSSSFLRIAYAQLGGGAGQWRFTNGDGDQTLLTVNPIVRDQVYQVIARWNSVTHSEHGLLGQALELWIDGVPADIIATACLQQTTIAENNVYLGCVPSLDEKFSWDGHITDMTIGLHCPSYEELVRI